MTSDPYYGYLIDMLLDRLIRLLASALLLSFAFAFLGDRWSDSHDGGMLEAILLDRRRCHTAAVRAPPATTVSYAEGGRLNSRFGASMELASSPASVSFAEGGRSFSILRTTLEFASSV